MTRDQLIETFHTWSPDLLRLLTLAEWHTATRVIAELPVGHRWPHRSSITLVGDAAHLMSPFSGEGANLAMRDAADLALTIVNASHDELDLDEVITAFEERMCGRAEEAAVGAAAGVREAFSEDAITIFTAEMQSRGQEAPKMRVLVRLVLITRFSAAKAGPSEYRSSNSERDGMNVNIEAR